MSNVDLSHTTPASPLAAHETLGQKITDTEQKILSILDRVGNEAEQGLAFLDKYALPTAKLVALIFPEVGPEAIAAAIAIDLIQKTVLMFKAHSALTPGGVRSDQMLAYELQLIGPTVVALLADVKVNVSITQVENIIQAVVAVLNAVPAAV